MKGYKIDLMPYEYEDAIIGENGEETKKKKTRYIKFELPRILCNPNLRKNIGKQEPDPEYDLLELGVICQKIEHEKEFYIVISKQELEIVKKRIKDICKFFGYVHYEMFRRVIEAEEIELGEKSK